MPAGASPSPIGGVFGPPKTLKESRLDSSLWRFLPSTYIG